MENKLEATIKYLIDIKKVPEMTPKKLQKMLFYCFSWHLALTAENDSDEEIKASKLFNSDFEAWAHGPVIPEVYNRYKKNRYSIIDNSEIEINIDNVLNDDEIDTINQVIEIYGDFNGNKLEQLSHSEDPWMEARGDIKPLDISTEIIDCKKIYNFYSSQLV
ncbi:Panacea domain-containing protein [Streptococcus halichoeri]|uniref:Panacea domain-containing protein n=1 Tax=Streptococcus halichoeri TaxID=254785 RepID=UPI001C8ED6A9|nr:type II toxin-antitoxin system antitoxin SocA domain-containing protein [Streptococcus halichoeri]